MNRTKAPRIPTYINSHPPELATLAALDTDGLKPADDQKPAALLRVRGPGWESLLGLYERRKAVAYNPPPAS